MERWDSYKGCALQKILFGNSPSIWFPLSYMYERRRQKSIETASRWFKVSKYSLTISEVCVIFFSLGFSSFPDALMCVLTCVGPCMHAYGSLLCNNQVTLLSQIYFFVGCGQFVTIVLTCKVPPVYFKYLKYLINIDWAFISIVCFPDV